MNELKLEQVETELKELYHQSLKLYDKISKLCNKSANVGVNIKELELKLEDFKTEERANEKRQKELWKIYHNLKDKEQ